MPEFYQTPMFSRADPWTDDERELFLQLYGSLSYPQIAAILGRTENAVRNYRYEKNIAPVRTYWSAADLQLLHDHYSSRVGLPPETEVLAAQLSRSIASVHIKASRLGYGNRGRQTVERVDGFRPGDRRPKYASDEERKAAASEAGRRNFESRRHTRFWAHPIGPEQRERIRQQFVKYRASLTQEQRSEIGRKAARTRVERYGHGGPLYMFSENPYSRARGGRREDLDNRYFRSSWEANYARYLRFLKDRGEIQSWEYECERFVFHGVTRGALTYTPDFKVTENDGAVVYHEIKGWMDPKSKGKLKRMAKFYPEAKIIIIGESEYKAIAKWRGMIEGWEIPTAKNR